MATVYDIEANNLIEEAAKELSKGESMKAPVWAAFVKTGASKERPPVKADWWSVRAAAILRTIYRSKGPIGVQKLRIKYGGKRNRGHKPEKFYKASGKIIRVVLQQLEKAELIKKAEAGVHKGRIISPKGKSFLDKIASKIAGSKPKKAVKPEAPKAEETPKEEPKAGEKPTETPKSEEEKSSTLKKEAKPAKKPPTKEKAKEEKQEEQKEPEASKEAAGKNNTQENKPEGQPKDETAPEAPKEELKPEENKNG